MMGMSAIDELRRMLDERGIWHHDHDHSNVRVTEWANGGKRDARYEEWSSGTVRLDASNVTAEQAITATVDRGTCHDVNESPLRFECSECGGVSMDTVPRFCPCCGRRVEE